MYQNDDKFMSWKDDLLELKRQERWMDIIVSCEQQIQKDNNSADSYIQTIYLTHDILLEEYPTRRAGSTTIVDSHVFGWTTTPLG